MRGFDLEQLRTFVAVADSGSLSAAAPRLFLSQSSVSEQLRKLEERAGVPLLLRGRRGVQP
ncbi:LysR family transcriptional regulator, partial [Cupriavidus sp. HPC(L)]|uniref:helix-turn-helix domain-containing protein n=2 Tax=Cupriavidus TaxID=106589 RepID=UPI0005BB7271